MAPRRKTTPRSKFASSLDYSNLKIEDVLCPLCRRILVEPVTLPCTHCFCHSCFQGTLENANLNCPLCLARFGSWYRTAKKHDKLTNEQLWVAIRSTFPKNIQNRIYEDRPNGSAKPEPNKTPATSGTATDLQRPSCSYAAPNNANSFTDYWHRPKGTNNNTNPKLMPNHISLLSLCDGGGAGGSGEQLQSAGPSVPRSSPQLMMGDGGDASNDSDSINMECSHFKPIEARNVPASVKSVAVVRVLAVYKNTTPPANPPTSSSPCGQHALDFNEARSAFTAFTHAFISVPRASTHTHPHPTQPQATKRTFEQSNSTTASVPLPKPVLRNSIDYEVIDVAPPPPAKKERSAEMVKASTIAPAAAAVKRSTRNGPKANTSSITNNNDDDDDDDDVTIAALKVQEQTDLELAKQLHKVLNRSTRSSRVVEVFGRSGRRRHKDIALLTSVK